MNIREIAPGEWRLDVRHERNGREYRKRVTFRGARRAAEKEYWKVHAELEKRAEARGSLTPTALRTFGEVLHFYQHHKGYGSMWSTFEKLDADQGKRTHAEIRDCFGDYLLVLGSETCETTGRARKVSTLNRYLQCAKRAYAFAVKHEKVTKNPLAAYDSEPEEARDRVLSANEEKRLLTTLQRTDSYLYWPVYFSLRNPIRVGDLRNLTWRNLDETEPWIHFYPSKTRRKRKRETVLPFLDKPLLDYFDRLKREHPDNPYLFPYIRTRAIREKGREVGREVVVIRKLSNYKKAWAAILAEADIEDFHWHDLKHCAITWMLDNGYTERDIKDLGIQYTDAMIDRYYKSDAKKVKRKWESGNTGLVAGHFAQTKPKIAVSA
ncbi:MAG: tyrosine-type recombinase/integrase [Chitinivibrionales bacterium]|nr:tyrosine-type recombinase/integrase [Chitinivibrionales bacterium]